MKVVLLPGDGIGKEISESVLTIDKYLNTGIEWETYEAGAEYYEKSGKLIQDGLLDAVKECSLLLKGPTATPIGTGFRSINVELRQTFNTYANLRPVYSIEGVPSRYEHVNLVIFRENSEDLYRGIEYKVNDDIVNGIKIITRSASERICRSAFEYAIKNHRHKVTAVHKANIMKLADGLFLEAFHHVAKEYPTIETDTVIIDALCMKLVTDPTKFDVLVTENLYGDIISDLCAGLVGGLGFAPSVNIGDNTRIYEAVHGSAPDIAGQNIANPSALLMAYAMLLNDYNMSKQATLLIDALKAVIKKGAYTTKDIGGTASTVEFTDALIKQMKKG